MVEVSNKQLYEKKHNNQNGYYIITAGFFSILSKEQNKALIDKIAKTCEFAGVIPEERDIIKILKKHDLLI